MIGQGLTGMAINIIRIIFLIALPPNSDLGRDDTNGFIGCVIYFAFSAVFLVVCIVVTFVSNFH
jgi:hypothetical protein